MGSHWVLFLLYFNIVLNWPEDGRLRPKHVAKYNPIVIIASCLDVCCVVTVVIYYTKKLIVAFRNFANAPKKLNSSGTIYFC